MDSKGFCEWMGIDHPIIMAPMFLVSNVEMIKAAQSCGITGAIPALNYRTDAELRAAISELKKSSDQPFGINLIVNKSNPKYKKQLETCIEMKVDFIITSLGSPKEVILKAKPAGIKVFCDVTDLKYAMKVASIGADAVIAVNSNAGGHAGPTPPEVLIPDLVAALNIPVISAGGVANKAQLDEVLALGAVGASIGSIFIASKEAHVSEEYKQAVVDYGAKDIVFTTKLSGSPLTVINTDYVQKMNTKAGFLERLVKRNKRFKKLAKMLLFVRGMKKIEKAAFQPSYKTVWCAGPSIEHVNSIRPIKEIVADLT